MRRIGTQWLRRGGVVGGDNRRIQRGAIHFHGPGWCYGRDVTSLGRLHRDVTDVASPSDGPPLLFCKWFSVS